jgi:hypothetical protein
MPATSYYGSHKGAPGPPLQSRAGWVSNHSFALTGSFSSLIGVRSGFFHVTELERRTITPTHIQQP